MSGLEVAGLVLGALPIMTQLIDSYRGALTSDMRLLDLRSDDSLQVMRAEDAAAPYRILSHTWSNELGQIGKPRVQRQGNQGTRFELILPGQLSGHTENALVDTGAINFISKSFTLKHAIAYDRSSTQFLTVADGSKIPTEGSVSLPWTFMDESTTHWVDFQVVADKFCNCAVTFGMNFMKTTRTLTSFAHRVVRRARTALAAHVRLQGGSGTRMMGYCEGHSVTAVPDTGADVPLMSLNMAKYLGLEIDTSKNYQIDLELPGKHIVRTLGMVPHVDWRFGQGNEEDGHLVDFFILDGLPVDLVLDEELLHNANAFQAYEDYTIDLEDDLYDSQELLYLTIRLAKQRKSILSRMFAKGNSFCPPRSELVLISSRRKRY